MHMLTAHADEIQVPCINQSYHFILSLASAITIPTYGK